MWQRQGPHWESLVSLRPGSVLVWVLEHCFAVDGEQRGWVKRCTAELGLKEERDWLLCQKREKTSPLYFYLPQTAQFYVFKLKKKVVITGNHSICRINSPTIQKFGLLVFNWRTKEKLGSQNDNETKRTASTHPCIVAKLCPLPTEGNASWL